MQFWPAFNGNDEPFDPISVSRTYVLNQFAQQKSVSTDSLNYDFAIMLLTKPAPAGTAQLAIQAGSGTQRFDLTTAGYPGGAVLPAAHRTTCGGIGATCLSCQAVPIISLF